MSFNRSILAKTKSRKPRTRKPKAQPQPVQFSYFATSDGVVITMPAVVESEANQREHWIEKNGRKKKQQDAVMICLLAARHAMPPGIPSSVEMVRLCQRRFDDDNEAGAFKHVRDQIAGRRAKPVKGQPSRRLSFFDCDDGPGGPIAWSVRQEISDRVGIRVVMRWNRESQNTR